VYLTAPDVLPVSRAGLVISLWMQERPLICRVAKIILNKQSRTVDKGYLPA